MNKVKKAPSDKSTNQKLNQTRRCKACALGHCRPKLGPCISPLNLLQAFAHTGPPA